MPRDAAGSPVVPETSTPVVDEPVAVDDAHGLIGHNSRGLDEEEAQRRSVPAASGLSIADLAARAASIDAAHVAARRASLPVVVAPAPAARRFLPDAVREPVRSAVPGSIADLVARAASVHSSHVAAGRKRLAAFTIPATPSPGKAKTGSAEGRRNKHKET